MGKKPPENILNEHLVEMHWDKIIVTSGTFEGLSVQEARDLNDEANKKKKPIEKIVEAYKKKKVKGEPKDEAKDEMKDEPEPAPEPAPEPEPEKKE